MAEEDEEDKRPIIIKKIKKGGGGHHGGAWKVAYADFVTAMMAFFLLLWLLNVTTEEQKNAISNFFDPTHPKISDINSGAGGILAGTSLAETGAYSSTRAPAAPKTDDGKRTRKKTQREKFEEKLKAKEQQRFKDIEKQIRNAMQRSAELIKLANNVLIDITPEGLRIQIIDQDGASMFPSGSASMFQKTKDLFTTVAEVIKGVPNDISIRGHTDSVSYGAGAKYTNWELSADRANATRQVLMDASIPEDKVFNVQGKADTDHLFPNDPKDARNRRVSIILLNEDFTDIPSPPGMIDDEITEADEPVNFSDDLYEEEEAPMPSSNEGLYNKSQGNVQFP